MGSINSTPTFKFASQNPLSDDDVSVFYRIDEMSAVCEFSDFIESYTRDAKSTRGTHTVTVYVEYKQQRKALCRKFEVRNRKNINLVIGFVFNATLALGGTDVVDSYKRQQYEKYNLVHIDVHEHSMDALVTMMKYNREKHNVNLINVANTRLVCPAYVHTQQMVDVILEIYPDLFKQQ